MSSSRIIRSGGAPAPAYTLEPLGGERPGPGLVPEGFRAVSLGGQQSPELDALEEPPAPPCIPEEEALRRIEQAHVDGVKIGRLQAEEELSKVSEALAQALLATGSLRHQLLHDAEEDLLKLSAQIARKVMLRELAGDPAILAGLVRGAVELASDAGEIVVRLNPEDYAVAVQCPEFADLLRDGRRVTLKADSAVARAGCLVETVRGNIDAGLDAQLDEILGRLSEEKSARRESPGQ